MKPGFVTLVLRNLRRRPGRHGVMVLCVAAVAGLQMGASLLEGGAARGFATAAARLGADLVAAPDELDQTIERSWITGEAELHYLDRSVEDKIRSYPFVARTSAQVYLKSLTGASCCSAGNIFLVGFDPVSDFTVRPWLEEHREVELTGNRILVGWAMGVAPGDTMRFYGQRFQVAGKLAETGSGLDATVFMPLDAAYRMAAGSALKAERTLDLKPGMISVVLIKLKPEAEGGLPPDQAALELNKGIYEISVIEPARMVKRAHHGLDAAVTGLRAAGLGMWPLTALLLGLVFALTVNERRGELGVLRALGAGRGFIHGLIVTEALVLAGLGALLGAGTAMTAVLGFSRLIGPTLAVPFLRPTAREVLALAATVMGAALMTAAAASLAPAWSASHLEPYRAIRGD